MTAGVKGLRRNVGHAASIVHIGNIKLVCLRNVRIPSFSSPHGVVSERT